MLAQGARHPGGEVANYMGGLALMVISTKNWEFCPSLCPHCVLFNQIWSLLLISSEPIGRGESWYAKIWSNKSLHWLSNQNQTFFNFWFTIFKISYFINWRSFWHILKSESWALVSAILWHNMNRLYMFKTHGNFHESNKKM